MQKNATIGILFEMETEAEPTALRQAQDERKEKGSQDNTPVRAEPVEA